jgi:hypothetical protein
MTDDQPTERNMFARGAAAKARRHGRLLVALGATTRPEPEDPPADKGEREEPPAPAA